MDLATFLDAATGMGFALDAAAIDRIMRFREALAEGNRRAALTTRFEEADYLEVHVLDALSLSRALAGEEAPKTLLDIGTGAGLPAVPLAIAYPSLEVTALESTAKKCDFLRRAVASLGLGGRFHVVERRAEEAGRDPALRDRIDLVTARAVAALPTLAELALPFVRPGGLFVAYKGAGAERDEVPAARAAIAALAAELEAVIESGISGRDLRLVKIRKTGPTPERYPRRTGVPAKRPLR